MQSFLENDRASSECQLSEESREHSSHEDKEKQTREIQLKGNIIPPYFVSLEKFFNRHDAYIKQKRVKKGPTIGEYEGVNISNVDDPKMINIGKCCSLEEKEVARLLFEEYRDVFAWSYDDLKSYRDGRVKHQIPLKSNKVPFQLK